MNTIKGLLFCKKRGDRATTLDDANRSSESKTHNLTSAPSGSAGAVPHIQTSDSSSDKKQPMTRIINTTHAHDDGNAINHEPSQSHYSTPDLASQVAAGRVPHTDVANLFNPRPANVTMTNIGNSGGTYMGAMYGTLNIGTNPGSYNSNNNNRNNNNTLSDSNNNDLS